MSSNSQRNKENVWTLDLSPSRIGAICDGIFAVAMTLLVFELSTDHVILESIAFFESGDLSYLFVGINAYVMGFVVLGVYWILHHYMFHFIKRSNGVLVWLHVLFLMFAALVPLSTKVSRTYPDSINGFVFYYASTVITILLLLVIWQYATRGYRLVDSDIDKLSISFVNNVIIIGVAIMTISTIGEFYVSGVGYLGYGALAYVIVATAYGHHKPFFKGRTKTS